MEKLEYKRMRKENESLYRQLVYEVARLFVEERKIHVKEIINSVYGWASKNANDYYHADGEKELHGNWVSRRLVDAIKNHFVSLGNFEDAEIKREILDFIRLPKDVTLNFAPNYEVLLKQACLDFDKKLTNKVKASPQNTQVVVGVSGGKTTLDLSKTLRDIRESLKWNEVPSKQKKNVIICSLTSGGSRVNIAALSDTVAANIAQELDVQASGFLGPPLFKDKESKDIFIKDKEVRIHIDLAHKANIILTSVGNITDPDDNALTSQIIKTVDLEYLKQLRENNKHLGDILYNCYNGHNGNPIPIAPIHDRVFSVITCKDLWTMVSSKQTECIVVAKGYDKGYHALRGVISRGMASDIHMDLDCAHGLRDVGREEP